MGKIDVRWACGRCQLLLVIGKPLADGSANLVASVVLRGAEEGLHTRQMRPLCVAPAPKQPDPALD